MARIGIAMDLGTSGFRGQAIDLDQDGAIISTAVTTRHPFPGANVIDHLHFALEVGISKAHEVLINAVNKVIGNLKIAPHEIVRLAVCGNPIQLSLFEGIEFRDLAYAGKRKLEALGVVPPARNAHVLRSGDIDGLQLPEEAEILIPPAVRHEIGADALAMMIQTGMLEKEEIAIVTDYGTNAEMALIVGGTVYTGSTAAGPALEGQQIEDGILALPGAISDVIFEPEQPDILCKGPVSGPGSQPMKGSIRTFVLDAEMMPRAGATVDPSTGKVLAQGELKAVGITGTGVVALLSQGLKANLIRIPRIESVDSEIHLQDGIKFTEEDLAEAGKAIGAIRAGHITLCHEAGINLEDIETAYMSGASGTYVDALKAQEIGMIPAGVKRIFQVGNTSLAMARDMVRDISRLWAMQEIADNLRQNHCMFAASKIFEKVYILELSYWTEGMPREQYQKFLRKYGLPALVERTAMPEVIRTVERDIPDLGHLGLNIIPDIGERKTTIFEGCIGDAACVLECPENALQMKRAGEDYTITINLALCNGVACRRCERVCKAKGFDLIRLLTSSCDPREPGSARGAGVTGEDERLNDPVRDIFMQIKGISGVASVTEEDRREIRKIEEEAESRSLMGLGKVINAGIREVLGCDSVYVALTNMDFDWACQANLVMKKGDEIVGEEVNDPGTIESLSKNKNAWFLHRNFVVYKDKISFPQDVMQKICHFEIPLHSADWLKFDGEPGRFAIYGSPSTPCDVFLKQRYFESHDARGFGTVLIGVRF